MTTDVVLLTIDVETTLNAPKDVGTAHPMHPDNYAVYLGYKYSDVDTPGVVTYPKVVTFAVDHCGSPIDFIVGCNLSFDLCYLYRYSTDKKFFQKQRLWDIQLAEYLLSGQQSRWPSLDVMSAKYGLPTKDEKISKYFEAGVGADKIPYEEIVPYLEQDVRNTEIIAQSQMQEAFERKMLPLIISQMEALHACTEMMYNGLAIDMPYFGTYAAEVATTYANLKTDIQGSLATAPPSFYPVADVDSSLQWSKYLFGGDIKYETKEPVGMFKNGKVKYKKVVKTVRSIPCCDVVPLDDWKTEKTGRVSVDDKVLSYVISNTKIKLVKTELELLQKYRETSKQLTTYIQGLGKHVISTKEGNNYIYGRLQQVTTATGRLSSSSPNLQNISNNPIKKIFKSRFPDGLLVEFDFSQLEVAILAHVSKDRQLLEDITGGTDIHTALYVDMNGCHPTEAARKAFKRLTFGLLYGAGATTLAENAGCSVDVSKKFIATFYKRYIGVHRWHAEMAERAMKAAEHRVGADGMRQVERSFTYSTETGRYYVFKEYKSTYRTDRDYSFSPTELKNYPIQGLATGDIVPMMLGILFRELKDLTNVKLVNTVHDSILFDVSNQAIKDGIISKIKAVLNNTHVYYEKTFGVPLSLKLSAGCQLGQNWYEMKELGE